MNFSLPVKNSMNQHKALVKTGRCWCGHFSMLIDMESVTVRTVTGVAVFGGKVFRLYSAHGLLSEGRIYGVVQLDTHVGMDDACKHLELRAHVPVAKPKTQAAHRLVCPHARGSR